TESSRSWGVTCHRLSKRSIGCSARRPRKIAETGTVPLTRVRHEPDGGASGQAPSDTRQVADRNVLGGELEPCGADPLTGFYRDGCCRTGPENRGEPHDLRGGHGRVPRASAANRQRPDNAGARVPLPRPRRVTAGV